MTDKHDSCPFCRIRELEDREELMVGIAKECRALFVEHVNPLLRMIDDSMRELGLTDEQNDMVAEGIRRVRDAWSKIPDINGGG
jgi:chemotaxis regulatin CheY-phosphate phosphatase CheZ